MQTSSNRYRRLLKQQSIAFLVAATLASCLLIAIGGLLEDQDRLIATVAIAFGGSALGTCFGIAFGGLADASATHRIREIVEESMSSPFKQPDEYLLGFKLSWHCYYLSQNADTHIWRYLHLDFGVHDIPGKLLAQYHVPHANLEESTVIYKMEGYIVGSKLLLIQQTTGTESPSVFVFPNITFGFKSSHAGIATLQTWDGNEISGPTILSRHKIDLKQKYEEGTVPASTNDILNSHWVRASRKTDLTVARSAPAPST